MPQLDEYFIIRTTNGPDGTSGWVNPDGVEYWQQASDGRLIAWQNGKEVAYWRGDAKTNVETWLTTYQVDPSGMDPGEGESEILYDAAIVQVQAILDDLSIVQAGTLAQKITALETWITNGLTALNALADTLNVALTPTETLAAQVGDLDTSAAAAQTALSTLADTMNTPITTTEEFAAQIGDLDTAAGATQTAISSLSTCATAPVTTTEPFADQITDIETVVCA